MPQSWREDELVTQDIAHNEKAVYPNFDNKPSIHADIFDSDVLFPAQSSSVKQDTNSGISIPVAGKIAAGSPIDAIQDNMRDIPVPSEMIGNGNYFALVVEGNSMINAGILEGDTVILRQTSLACCGEIVVALIDDTEATLKIFRKEGNTVVLEAANPDYEIRKLSANRVNIQGKLVGLIRQYN